MCDCFKFIFRHIYACHIPCKFKQTEKVLEKNFNKKKRDPSDCKNSWRYAILSTWFQADCCRVKQCHTFHTILTDTNSKCETRTSGRCGWSVVQESEAIITPKTQKLGESSNRFDKKRFVWTPQWGDKPAVISRRHLKEKKMYPGGAKEVISWSWDSKGDIEGLSVLFASWLKILNWRRMLQNANTLNLWQEVSKGGETSLVFNTFIFFNCHTI